MSKLDDHSELLDAAKRASDIINTYIVHNDWDDIKNKFIAIRLSDGGYDGVLYDSKKDAVTHQLHETLCAYVCFRNLMGGAKPREMQAFLTMNRNAYNAGARLVDPDDQFGGPDLAPVAAVIDDIRWRQNMQNSLYKLILSKGVVLGDLPQ